MTLPLIPRKVLFDNPDKASTQLSPDGVRLGFLAPVDGVLNVWVGPADEPEAARPVTQDRGRGIRFYTWAYTSQDILYLQDKDGDENWRLYAVNLETNKISDLTPIDGVQARLQQRSPHYPSELLIALNDRTPELHDIYRINLQTGTRELVQHNDRFTSFLSDDDFRIRFAIQMTPDGGKVILQPTQDGQWSTFATIPMEDELTTDPVGFDRDGRTLYLIDSRSRDTAALYAIDTETGKQSFLHRHRRGLLSRLFRRPL